MEENEINYKRRVTYGSAGMEQKRKRIHGHGRKCGDYGVEVEVEEGIRRINGNGKKYDENHSKK